MLMPLEKHYEIITRHKKAVQEVIDKASELHQIEIQRIDSQYSAMDVLAFGISGAVLALNSTNVLSSWPALIGIMLLIGNAFWNFIAQLDQFEINKNTAKKRMDYVSEEGRKLLDAFHRLVDNQNDENELKLMNAGMEFIENFNKGAMTEAPRTKLTKWLGKRGYFYLYVLGMIFIAVGVLQVRVMIGDDKPSHVEMRYMRMR